MHMPMLKRRWTLDDVHSLPDDGNRYEVIDGALFVSPAPVWRHQVAVLQLSARLLDYLRRERVGQPMIAPADVIFSTTRLVQPDVFVVPLVNGRRPETFDEVGRLEVLSPSTARADRVAKRTLFREQEVPEYWVVDLDARTFERSTPTDTRPEVLSDELIWHPLGASAPLLIDLSAYFALVLFERQPQRSLLPSRRAGTRSRSKTHQGWRARWRPLCPARDRVRR